MQEEVAQVYKRSQWKICIEETELLCIRLDMKILFSL